MSGIFISYRRSDSRGSAGRIYDNLEARLGSDQVFRDLDALEPGAEYAGAIEAFISSCDAVVAVIGNQWLDARDEAGRRRIEDPADLVRREIEVALGQDKLVIPVLVEDAVMPKMSELPGELAALAARNALPVSDERWDYDVGRLVQILERAVSPGSPLATPEGPGRSAHSSMTSAHDSPDVSPAPASAGRARTIRLVAVGMVLALIAIVAIGALTGGTKDQDDPTASAQPSDTDGSSGDAPSDTPGPAIILSTASASLGEEIAVSGTGFDAGETVSITYDGEQVTDATADDDGAFEGATFTVPDDAESGEHGIAATGDDSGLSAEESFEVS